MNNELLNKIAALLNTTDKNLVITVAIKSLIEQGAPVRVAYDAVLGEGAYENLKGQVYDALQ